MEDKPTLETKLLARRSQAVSFFQRRITGKFGNYEIEVSTSMKILRILCFSAALLLPLMAQAALPFSNEGFGTVEGILDFCAQADSASAGKYEERKKALVRNVAAQEVADARASQEYKDAYDSTKSKVEEQPKDKAVEACTAYLNEGKEGK